MKYPFGTVLRDPTDGEVVMSVGCDYSPSFEMDGAIVLVPRTKTEVPENVGDTVVRYLGNGIWEVVDEEADD